MENRLDYFSASPETTEILIAQEKCLGQQFGEGSTIAVSTWMLVQLRVSQINGCAYCIDMHCKDALAAGEHFEKLYGLSAWADMPFYSEQERVALEWAELLTAAKPVSDMCYRKALECFGAKGLVDLSIAVNAINAWNRIAKAFKPEVGSYQPG